MNKTLHKTIFNKKRGCLVVVAENTHSDGKGGGTGKVAVSLGRTLVATRLGMGGPFILGPILLACVGAGDGRYFIFPRRRRRHCG